MWRRRERAKGDDEGFSLVEVILAMVIIAGVLATMLGIVVSSLTTIAQARQRQTATALATQAMEEMRALPYGTITIALPTATPAATASYAVLDSGTYYLRTALPNLAIDEELIVNNISGKTEDIVVDEVTYRVHKYVTVGLNDAFNMTVLVAYTSGISEGERVTAQRSTTFSPTGCLSTAQNPFAAPCQAYFTADAGQAAAGITVINPLDATQPILGFADDGGTLLELGLPANGASLLVEQTASAMATAVTSGAQRQSATPGSSGAQGVTLSVDSDPTSVQNQIEQATTPLQTSTTQSLTGDAGTLRVVPGISDSGTASAAIQAPQTHCVIGAVQLKTGPDATHLRPCASSQVNGNTSKASLTYEPKFGGGFESIGPLTILSVGANTTTSGAVAAHLAESNVNACTAGSGPLNTSGCAFASATRALGEVRVGEVGVGGTGPVGMDDGIVRITNISESVIVEEGNGNRAPSFARNGVLKYWNGTTYVTQNIGPTTTGSYPFDVTVTYTAPSSKTITVHYQGNVKVAPVTSARTPATRTGNLANDCKAEACFSEYSGGSGIVITLNVSVVDGTTGTESGSFGVAANLGGLIAQASYKEAANA